MIGVCTDPEWLKWDRIYQTVAWFMYGSPVHELMVEEMFMARYKKGPEGPSMTLQIVKGGSVS